MHMLYLHASLLALAAPAWAHAATQDHVPPPAFAASDAPVHLFVELIVNGAPGSAILEVVQQDGRLLVDAQALRDAGLTLAGEGLVDLATLSGVDAHYDAERQQLLLHVDTALLPVNQIAGKGHDRVHTSISPGALLNYDLFAQRSGGQTSLSLWSEQRLFGPAGIVSNTGVLRASGSGRKGYVRYDSSYRYIDEDHALAATAGDTISGALAWSTSVRMGGVQLARSFRIRPDLITVPLPDFGGQAALPSSVDLFINGYRQQQAQVAPGRFVLDNVPVINGAGEARVITTDAVGRQVATVIPFYVAPELLRPGLTDFSFELGALRRDYGLRSLSYGRALASAAVRRGITSRLTLEGHGELTRDLALGGVGAVWAPGLWGAMHGSTAISRRDGLTGTQWVVGYSYASRHFSIGAEHRERSRDFADLGSFDLARWRGGASSDRVSGNVVLGQLGSIGIAYVSARTRDFARARIASASWSLSLGRRLSAFAAIDHDLESGRTSAQMRFVMSLGRSVASVGASRQSARGLRVEGDYALTVPSEGGLGYGVSGALDESGRFSGQANGVWRGPAFEVTAGAARTAGASSLWGGASGSIAVLGGKAYVANELPNAFAVVNAGMADVSVYYENQLVGRTGRDGRLFVPRVTPYHPGRFAIDAIDLPAGAVAPVIEGRIAVRENSGAVIAMPVRMMTSATLALIDGQGLPLPPGSAVTLGAGAAGTASVVGWDGIVMLEGIGGPVVLHVDRPGGVCTARIDMPAHAQVMANLGTVSCH